MLTVEPEPGNLWVSLSGQVLNICCKIIVWFPINLLVSALKWYSNADWGRVYLFVSLFIVSLNTMSVAQTTYACIYYIILYYIILYTYRRMLEWLMNYKLERMWKVEIVAYFELVCLPKVLKRQQQWWWCTIYCLMVCKKLFLMTT
jgi:hypothetical protein